MKIYTFGAEDAPVLLLLPGTCCHWKSNFGAVIPLLADSFRVLCVSYDGFDETEQTEFLSGASRISRVWGRHSPTRFPQGQNERKANFGTAVESCSKKLPDCRSLPTATFSENL